MLNDIETGLASYPTLAISVGIPLLTLIVTVTVTLITTCANGLAHRKQRQLESQLKLAEFRQAWIDGMREDLALYTALTWSAEANEGVDSEKARVIANARVLMRMDTEDPNYEAVQQSMHSPRASKDKGRRALYQIGQDILKAEQTRLIADLEAVDGKR